MRSSGSRRRERRRALVASSRSGRRGRGRFLGRISDAESRRALPARSPSSRCRAGRRVSVWSTGGHVWGLPCMGRRPTPRVKWIVAGETGELVPMETSQSSAPRSSASLGSRRAARMGDAGRRRAREHFRYSRFRSTCSPRSSSAETRARATRPGLPVVDSSLSNAVRRTRMPDYTARPCRSRQEGAAVHADVRTRAAPEHHPRPVKT